MKDFKAIQMLSTHDATVDVTHFNGSMAICSEEGPVLITREQAIEFFNLNDIVNGFQVPRVGSIWSNRNDHYYEVVMLSNTTSVREDYPPTITYKDTGSDTVWSSPLSNWHNRMEFIS